MCDTIVNRQSKQSSFFFAKNSDRDPGEPQLIQYVEPSEGINKITHPERRSSYDAVQYRKLIKAFESQKNSYKALISRPAWMWGAEMGVNEKGVAIGNEAVFAKSRVERDGLLGMDILRLALHNSATSGEAVNIIASLLETYGQGGNGSYSGNLKYHNSFLIADSQEAWVLESAARKWAARRINKRWAISNAYSLDNRYDLADEKTLQQSRSFSQVHSSSLHQFFTQGHFRQKRAMELAEVYGPSWEAMTKILRHNEGKKGSIDRSMRSINMDASGLVKSRTTASMIVEYHNATAVVWLTGSPLPSYSPFIPFSLDATAFASSPFKSIDHCYAFAVERTNIAECIRIAQASAKDELAALAKRYENQWRQKVVSTLPLVPLTLIEQEKEFRKEVVQLLKEYGIEKERFEKQPAGLFRVR
ncbi:MAG: C69 family dipeptidase [Sphaerochaetaceae bacterium]